MSHALDFKSSGSNKDAGLKRSSGIRSPVAQTITGQSGSTLPPPTSETLFEPFNL